MSKFDPVDLWISNVAYSHSKSVETETNYRRCLKRFCGFIGCSPQQILDEYEESNDRQFRRKYAQLLKAFISSLMGENLAVGTVRTISSAVKSFFKYSDLPLGYVPLGANKIVYHNRDITKDEIKHILRVSMPRDRAAFCMLAQSGLRPDTIRKLKLKHVEPELSKHIVPCKIVVPEEVTKGMFGSYFTFMGEESVRYLKAYLDRRKGKLGPEDFLFTSKGSDKQLDSRALTKVFRRTLEKLKSKGLISFEQKAEGKPRELRLYNLRGYFRKQAHHGDASIEYVNFWMGHRANYKASHIPASDEHYASREDVEFQRKLYAENSMKQLRLDTGTPDEHEKEIIELRRKVADYEKRLNNIDGYIARLEAIENHQKAMDELILHDEKFLRILDEYAEESGLKGLPYPELHKYYKSALVHKDPSRIRAVAEATRKSIEEDVELKKMLKKKQRESQSET